jgi:hypothetical protein
VDSLLKGEKRILRKGKGYYFLFRNFVIQNLKDIFVNDAEVDD